MVQSLDPDWLRKSHLQCTGFKHKSLLKKKSEHNDTVRDRATDHLIVEFILDVLYVKMPIILGKHTFLAPLFTTEWTLSALVSSVILVYASTFYRLKLSWFLQKTPLELKEITLLYAQNFIHGTFFRESPEIS